ncbi:unnamed protein product, partial [Ectocarpus fasciculatus]
GEALPLPRRRQSNTGRLKELVQAWPEVAAAPAPTSESSRGGGGGGSNGSDNGGGGDGDGGSPSGALELGSARRRRAAKALLSDRALLAGVFRQLSGGASGQQARDGLDRARLVKLFRYARMPLDLSQEEAE